MSLSTFLLLAEEDTKEFSLQLSRPRCKILAGTLCVLDQVRFIFYQPYLPVQTWPEERHRSKFSEGFEAFNLTLK